MSMWSLQSCMSLSQSPSFSMAPICCHHFFFFPCLVFFFLPLPLCLFLSLYLSLYSPGRSQVGSYSKSSIGFPLISGKSLPFPSNFLDRIPTSNHNWKSSLTVKLSSCKPLVLFLNFPADFKWLSSKSNHLTSINQRKVSLYESIHSLNDIYFIVSRVKPLCCILLYFGNFFLGPEMNLGGGLMGSMPLPGSSVARKSVDVVPDQFPAGLRVLVVDDDPTCLTILEKMLMNCRYEVTKCNRAEIALNTLRENKNGYDIVISDVHMPDMDGFKLLEHIGLEMDLPVIMMSADDSKSVVMKGVTHGACDYLIKPVRIEALKTVWQHVVRKKKNEFKEIEQSGSLDDVDRQHKQDESEYSSPANEGNWQSAKRKADEEESEDNNDAATLKKPRVVWSVELHQQFVAAVNQLSIDKAVPKKILELMNVPGLTRENVASHLQKYRLYLRRLSGVSHQSGLNNSFMGPQDSGFGAISSLGGIDYQTLAVTGRLPAQTLAAYQAGIGRSTVKPGISMPFVDQRNLFSFETPKLRYGEGQQQQHSNADKQMNMLHGIPTTMEPKQLASLHQPTQPLGGLNAQTSGHGGQSGPFFMHMAQSQPRGQLLNESMGSQASGMHSPIGQTLPSSGASVGILPRNGMVESARGLAYNPVTQSSSSVVGFSVNNLTDLPGNSFPIGSTPGMSPLTSEGGLVQSEIKSDMKGSRGFAPSYDIFNDLQQHRTQDYQLQDTSLTYGASQQATALQNNVDVSPSILVQQGFSSDQSNEQNGSAFMGKTMFSTGLEHQRGISPSMDQTLNGLIVDSSSRVKTEDAQDIISSRSNLFPGQYGEDDLMSAILKQQSDLGPVGGDFDLDGYTLGNFPANEVFTSQ